MEIRATLAGLNVGDRYPVRIMGVINVSPESFYQGSIASKASAIARKARELTQQGADIIDVGAMSTAPYLKTRIPEHEEAERLSVAVKIIRKNSPLPISIDTSRAHPALAGLRAGATILNDVTGLSGDKNILPLLKKFRGLILMANPVINPRLQLTRPLPHTLALLRAALKKAAAAGYPSSRLVIDPGIGFFRDAKIPWWKWDIEVLKNLRGLRRLNLPILIGVSRKSFIGELMGGAKPQERLGGSLAATSVAVWNGAHVIRTHDVKETKDVAGVTKRLSGGWSDGRL